MPSEIGAPVMTAAAIGRGMIAGLCATIVLSFLMVMKSYMGLMPELDPIGMMAAMAGASTAAFGWIAHFVIGTVFWGVGFVLVSLYLPGSYRVRGVLFAIAAWLGMMVVLMPMAGAGVFGLSRGMMVPIAALAMHVVFGVVLGSIYGLLSGDRKSLQRYAQ
jgi:hypothetical protein